MYTNEPPAGQLRLASPDTVNFTVGMLSAVAELFPSTLFSTGGDEINSRCYADDAQTQRDLDGRTLNQASMLLRRQHMARSGNLARRQLCGKVRHTCLLIVRVTEDLCLGTEMVLNYNLTLSNDTIALYVTAYLSRCTLTNVDVQHRQGLDLIF